MKYDFDTVVDRMNAPYSYAAKWAGKGATAEMLKQMMGLSEMPADRLSFFLADMDFKCAPEIIEAMKKTAEHGIYGYSAIPNEYYDAVCRWFADRFDWHFKPEHIIPGSAGTHELIADCIKTLTKPGEGIVVMTPSYSYHNDIEPLGRVQASVPMINDNEYYTIDFDALEKACADPNNTLMIMMQPHNPTGRVFSVEELKKIADICRRNNVLIVSDEVHIDIARKGQKVVPMMKAVGPEGLITTTAVNKTFNVAGLAMCNMIVENEEQRKKLAKPFTMATPFGISAVISAYTECDQWVDELNEYLDMLLDYAVDRLHKEMPKLKVRKPEGTYVLYLNFENYGLTDEQLAQKINATHILMGDGAQFDSPNPKQYRRCCLTAPKSVVKEMLDRLTEAFKGL